MRDSAFLREILANPPSLIALSADDFDSPEDVQALADMSFDELRAAWKRIPRLHGQRRKAHEAIYTAKLAAATEGFPPILFNMVLHPGNIARASDMIAVLTREFPGVLINPFPAQSAFAYEDPALQAEHAAALRDFVDQMITAQTRQIQDGGSTEPFVPHLHYWLMLRAVFDWAGGDDAAAMRMITGDGIWQCYRESPAGFYVQVGLGADGQMRAADDQHPGGCLGCFWNKQTVTTSGQLWSGEVDAPAVRQHIQIGKQALANQSPKPCPGCAFPRLVGHIISTETGMDPRLLPFYMAHRHQTLGF